jgi:hypothetical protein
MRNWPSGIQPSCRDCIYVDIDSESMDIDGCKKQDLLEDLLEETRARTVTVAEYLSDNDPIRKQLAEEFEPKEDINCFTANKVLMQAQQGNETLHPLLYWGTTGGLIEFETRVRARLKTLKDARSP